MYSSIGHKYPFTKLSIGKLAWQNWGCFALFCQLGLSLPVRPFFYITYISHSCFIMIFQLTSKSTMRHNDCNSIVPYVVNIPLKCLPMAIIILSHVHDSPYAYARLSIGKPTWQIWGCFALFCQLGLSLLVRISLQYFQLALFKKFCWSLDKPFQSILNSKSSWSRLFCQ